MIDFPYNHILAILFIALPYFVGIIFGILSTYAHIRKKNVKGRKGTYFYVEKDKNESG
jgi:hypothetical protein